jgi:succinate dehydrogenase/fumarate reductase flavoprotein subunit
MIDSLKGEGTVQREFPGKYILFRRFGIDIADQPMLIFPTLHYQNGGLNVNNRCETNVPGLFAAGEVTGGLHGENRLMGNSLLDVIVFGRIAGRCAAEYIGHHRDVGRYHLDHVRQYNAELEEIGIERRHIAPMILPDYTNPEIHDRQLTTEYFGTLL